MTVTAIDLAIIRCLQANPRATNKSIGRSVGITEQTVKVRIRALTEDRVIRVMAQRDLPASGYPILAFAGVTAIAGAIGRVAQELAGLEEMLSVVLSAGTPEIVLNLVARDPAGLDAIRRRIAAVDGVVDVALTVATEIRLFRTGAGDLTMAAGPPLPAVDGDPTDEAIVALLVENGRLSNREIARRIDISEGSVRARLKRLAERRAMKLGVVCEPDKVGYGYAAYIFLDGAPDTLATLLDELSAWEMIGFAAVTTGAHGAVLFCVAPDERPITALCLDRLRRHPGVTRVTYRPLVRTLKHRYDYVHVGDPEHAATADYLARETVRPA